MTPVPTTEAALREALAERFRDWLHDSPASKCNMGSDTCADWDAAYELADIAAALRERPSLDELCMDCGIPDVWCKRVTSNPDHCWRWDYERFHEVATELDQLKSEPKP